MSYHEEAGRMSDYRYSDQEPHHDSNHIDRTLQNSIRDTVQQKRGWTGWLVVFGTIAINGISSAYTAKTFGSSNASAEKMLEQQTQMKDQDVLGNQIAMIQTCVTAEGPQVLQFLERPSWNSQWQVGLHHSPPWADIRVPTEKPNTEHMSDTPKRTTSKAPQRARQPIVPDADPYLDEKQGAQDNGNHESSTSNKPDTAGAPKPQAPPTKTWCEQLLSHMDMRLFDAALRADAGPTPDEQPSQPSHPTSDVFWTPEDDTVTFGGTFVGFFKGMWDEFSDPEFWMMIPAALIALLVLVLGSTVLVVIIVLISPSIESFIEKVPRWRNSAKEWWNGLEFKMKPRQLARSHP